MHALGLGLVCESMSFLARREAIGIGLPVLTDCTDATAACETGDELEVDFREGRFRNLTRGTESRFQGIPPALHDVVEAGGTTGWLQAWWSRQATAASSATT
jgi:3-isopropylmalate/(R)-2-methylmalate dehydratase small subunit